MFSAASYIFALTTIKDKGLPGAGTAAKFFYWHGVIWPFFFVAISLFFIGVKIYEYIW